MEAVREKKKGGKKNGKKGCGKGLLGTFPAL